MGAYRAAAAFAVGRLSSDDFAVFMAMLKILGVAGYSTEYAAYVQYQRDHTFSEPNSVLCTYLPLSGDWWCDSLGETLFPGRDLESQMRGAFVDGVWDATYDAVNSAKMAVTPEGWKAMYEGYMAAVDKDGYVGALGTLFVEQPIADAEAQLAQLTCIGSALMCAQHGGLVEWAGNTGYNGTQVGITGAGIVLGTSAASQFSGVFRTKGTPHQTATAGTKPTVATENGGSPIAANAATGRTVADPVAEAASAPRVDGVAAEPVARGWRVGESINNLTAAGREPSWSTVRARYWKNTAAEAIEGEYSAANMARMKSGKPPLHDEVGVAMELNHIVPRRDGGTHVIENLEPLWPWEHAAVDPYRFYTGPVPR